MTASRAIDQRFQTLVQKMGAGQVKRDTAICSPCVSEGSLVASPGLHAASGGAFSYSEGQSGTSVVFVIECILAHPVLCANAVLRLETAYMGLWNACLPATIHNHMTRNST